MLVEFDRPGERSSEYPGEGGYSLIWPIRGCTTERGMVFVLSAPVSFLNRVYYFAQVCPKQCA